MRVRTVLGLAAVLMLGVASDAFAQPGGGRGFGRGFGGGVSHMGLLRVEKIQEEISLTDDQQEQVEAARDELREARRGQGQGGGGFQDLSDEEREQFFARMRERRQELSKAEKAKLGEILKDEQMKRLGEIYVQVASGQALDDADVAASLKITDEQREKLTSAHAEARQKQRELFQSGDREGIREKMEELRKETDASLLAVLTEEQKQQFEQMKGEPIELTQQELARASGFGFGGRGRGQQ